jgi:hypothetical protein
MHKFWQKNVLGYVLGHSQTHLVTLFGANKELQQRRRNGSISTDIK